VLLSEDPISRTDVIARTPRSPCAVDAPTGVEVCTWYRSVILVFFDDLEDGTTAGWSSAVGLAP
jgi:hypothetical protein